MQANTQNSNQSIFKDTEEYYKMKKKHIIPFCQSQNPRDDDGGDGGLTLQSQKSCSILPGRSALKLHPMEVSE